MKLKCEKHGAQLPVLHSADDYRRLRQIIWSLSVPYHRPLPAMYLAADLKVNIPLTFLIVNMCLNQNPPLNLITHSLYIYRGCM